MTITHPNTAQADRDLIEDRLSDIDYRIGTGDQAQHVEEHLST
jgi:hypothetical protein